MSNIGGNSKGGGTPAGKQRPGAAKSTVANDTGARSNVSGGLKDGLTSLSKFDSEAHGPTYNYNVNSLTGNAPERIVDAVEKSSASKNGKSFDIC